MPDDCSAFNNIIENYNQISNEIYNLKMLLVFKLQNYGVRDASMSLSFEQLIHMVHNIPSVLCDVDGNIKPTNDVYQDIHLDNISTYNLELYQRILHYIKWLKYYLLLKGVPVEDVTNAQTLRDYIVLISKILRIKSTIFDAQYNQLDENDTPTNKIYIGKDNPIDIILMSEDFEDINDGYIVVEEDGEIIQRTRPSENIDTNQLQIMLAPTRLGEHTYTFYYEGTEQYLESIHRELILDAQPSHVYINVSIINISENSNYYSSEDTGYINDTWEINILTTTANGTPLPHVPLTIIPNDDRIDNTIAIITDDNGYYSINNFHINKYNSMNPVPLELQNDIESEYYGKAYGYPISIEFQSENVDDRYTNGYLEYLVNIYHYPYIFEQLDEYTGLDEYNFVLTFIDEKTGDYDYSYDGRMMHISLNNHAENVIIEHGQCLYTYPASLDIGNYIVTWSLFDIDYLFYDACDSVSGLSNYGSPVSLENETLVGTPKIEYDSQFGCYVVSNNNLESVMIPIPTLDGESNFIFSCEINMEYADVYPLFGIGVMPNQSDLDTVYAKWYGFTKNNTFGRKAKIGSENTDLPNSSYTREYDEWIKVILTFDSSNGVGIVWERLDGTVIRTYDRPVDININDRHYGIGLTNSLYYRYKCLIRNIKVERINGDEDNGSE